MKVKQPKPKKCKCCPVRFLPRTSTQTCCSWQCAKQLAEQERVKKERKERKEGLEKLKTRGDYVREAQSVFNQYVRLRDEIAGLPCVSCGRFHEGQWHAGHYMPTSTRPMLRLHELNVWRQCSPCNLHKHGNLVHYREELIRRIGIESVLWLESEHSPAKWSKEDLIEIKKTYQRKLKELKNAD